MKKRRHVRALIARLITVWLAALLAPGCLAASRVVPVEQYSSWAPDRPPVPVTEIRVVDDLAAHGMGIDRDGNIVIPNDHPTASDPHVVIGLYGIAYRSADKLPREKEREMAMQAAAKHGADAVYIGYRLGSLTYTFLHLSSAAPVYPPAAPFLDKLEKEFGTATFKRYGEDLARTLEGFEPVKVPARTMTCFGAAIALDADARLADDIGFQLQVVVTTRGKKRALSVPLTRPLPRSRSFRVQLGCYANSRDVSWQLATYPDGRQLGTGPVVVRSFAMPTDMQDLKRWCMKVQAADGASAFDESMCAP